MEFFFSKQKSHLDLFQFHSHIFVICEYLSFD